MLIYIYLVNMIRHGPRKNKLNVRSNAFDMKKAKFDISISV